MPKETILVVDDEKEIAELGAYPHLALTSTGEGTSFVDDALVEVGLRRRVACNAPLLAAPATLLVSCKCLYGAATFRGAGGSDHGDDGVQPAHDQYHCCVERVSARGLLLIVDPLGRYPTK